MRKPLPGSKRVQFEHSEAHHWIDLYISATPTKAQVARGIFYILIDSRKLAGDFMKKDEALTANLRYAQETCRDSFKDLMEGWIDGTLDCSNDEKGPPKGPKDWSPLEEKFHRRGKVTGHGNTYNFADSQWQGAVFEYVTFRLAGSGEQAIAVFWHRGGDPRGNYDAPEVWVGDVEGFFDDQQIDLTDMDILHRVNKDFDNGLVWAAEKLNLLKADERDMPDRLRELIEDDPALLSPETWGDIEAHPKRYASWVRDVVRDL